MSWSDVEKAAMQAAARERRAAKRKLSPDEARAEGEREVRERIAAMAEDAGKFKVRYSTLGFQHDAALDDGPMWPTSFAVLDLTPDARERIVALVRRAVG